ncbi:MAG: DUF5718 family protein [Planctomycetota bacterium]
MLDLKQTIGFGVAGNFAGHLEQAGEASDFVAVKSKAGAPKGVFPFYVPPVKPNDPDHFLHTFPLSADTVEHPGTIDGEPANLQIEPEIALLCELEYEEKSSGGMGVPPVTKHDRRPGRPSHPGCKAVKQIKPTHFAAYNDCSTRRPNATKISQKKNWGPNTKGLASDQWLPLDKFEQGGCLDRFRLACYLKRNGQLHTYGEDSPVAGPDGYGYMYGELVDWLIDRFNNQQDAGPLEDLPTWLSIADYPSHAIIAIGATRYTPLGESTYLKPGDESIVIAYDHTQNEAASFEAALLAGNEIQGAGQTCSVLRQRVVHNKKY